LHTGFHRRGDDRGHRRRLSQKGYFGDAARAATRGDP
jgi:hypothetical protein